MKRLTGNNMQQTAAATPLLPSDERVERSVLGGLLVRGELMTEVRSVLTASCFDRGGNAAVYEALERVYDRGDTPDLLLVMNELKRTGRLEEAGGAAGLAALSQESATTNLYKHACHLHDLHLTRRTVQAGYEIAAMAQDTTQDIGDTITESLRRIEAISEATEYDAKQLPLHKALNDSIAAYQQRMENGRITGITTGLENLDSILSGLKPQQLVILAARPAMGKTAMMLHMAKSAAESGVAVAVFSLEMSSRSLADRMIIAEGNIEAKDYRGARLSEAGVQGMIEAANRLMSLPITIDETSQLSIQQIKARAANLKRKGKCGLVLIDYLQLLQMDSRQGRYNREQEVSQCTREAKLMAKALDVPVVLLSQLSRRCEERADKTPILSDLRESGSIEQDADVVLMIHRPEYYDKDADEGVGVIRIAKQRDGQTGDIKIRYNKSLTRFAAYRKRDEENESTPF